MMIITSVYLLASYLAHHQALFHDGPLYRFSFTHQWCYQLMELYIYSYPVNMWAFCMYIYACRLLSGTVTLSTTIYGMGGMWDMCVAVSALGNTSQQLASTL